MPAEQSPRLLAAAPVVVTSAMADPQPALASAQCSLRWEVATSTSPSQTRVRVITSGGTINTLAGGGPFNFPNFGDNGPAIGAFMSSAQGVAVHPNGDIYVADSALHRIRAIDGAGIIRTIAGIGTAGFSGDQGPATSAALNGPYGLAFDAVGNLYVADRSNHRIRKINAAGIISTVAGLNPGYSGDGGLAVLAGLQLPTDVKVDSAGIIYIADQQNQMIRRVDTAGRIISAVGCFIAPCSTAEGGPATSANLSFPFGLAIDGSGNKYIVSANRVRRVAVGESGLGVPRLLNISTRAQVLTGNDVLIGGFIIVGPGNKTVVVRARGPSLVPFGVTNALVDPTMSLVRSSDQATIAINNDWGTSANAEALVASGFAPLDPLESAILVDLPAGAYTAIVSGSGNSTGVGIFEVFEADQPAIPLVNISTRGKTFAGNDAVIGGFIIQGDAPKTVVVRARGRSLIPHGITNVLLSGFMQLVRSWDSMTMATNSGWQNSLNSAELAATGFAPSDPGDAAILITLNPGAYTAVVQPMGSTAAGVVIVEVFAVP